ncbi:DUF1294 domain-containing protein [Bengtsoniella intestinalis]|uniref:DUF1294 domain-containing protein n=1 Tax=Bengtsoniella intestinalis TaxID=3073143 RepID=UPI00391FB71B
MKEALLDWILTPFGIVLCVLLVWNLFTFFAYGWDKFKAKRGSNHRTSEKTLILLAVFGGSVGALFGMKIWHHKTLHKKFSIGLPVILIIQVAIIVGLYVYLNFFR